MLFCTNDFLIRNSSNLGPECPVAWSHFWEGTTGQKFLRAGDREGRAGDREGRAEDQEGKAGD